MAITTLCAVVAALRVVPDKSQFFQYESVSLSCGQQETSADWRVKKNTSTSINQECSTSTERMNESHCFIGDLYPLDTGTYWCESAAGQCSDAVDIFVISGSVILESPALPVMEGDDVTLSCITTSSSNLTADFYKDGLLIESSWTGNITVLSVSQSDEGLYRCDVSGGGRSPESRLTVRAGRLDLPDSPITRLLLPVVGFCLSLVLLVSLMLLCLWRSHKGKERDVSYTDVIITQEPNRITDVSVIAATFYSTVKPGNT